MKAKNKTTGKEVQVKKMLSENTNETTGENTNLSFYWLVEEGANKYYLTEKDFYDKYELIRQILKD